MIGLSLLLAVLILFLALATGIGVVGAAVLLGRGAGRAVAGTHRRRTRRVGRVVTS